MNGVELEYSKRHQFINRIDPFQIPGDQSSGILAFINKQVPEADGSEDKKIQAYNFRLCMTKVPENRVPLTEPEGSDVSSCELLLRILPHASSRKIVHFDPRPNGKTDARNYGSFSTNYIGKNYEYPDGSYERRRQIVDEHFRYQIGFFYFLSNDPRVPYEVRREMSQWGLPRDEFIENNHWPLQLNIREARRMVSDFVLTENEVSGRRMSVNPVGMSSYSMESQNVQRIIASDKAGNSYVQNEGDFKITLKEPFGLPYESMVPRKNECLNLLVPVCLSASHVTIGSISREPIIMILGQSAATASVLSIDLNCSGKIYLMRYLGLA